MFTDTAKKPGTTFVVDDVVPQTDLLPVCRAHEALRENLNSDIVGCSDFHGTVVDRLVYQSLLAAVYTAFNQHRPLVLSPDAVWITIAQGVAHHMAIHGEELRSRFVSHQGRVELKFEVSDWVAGSPENPWAQAFANWTDQIRGHVGSKVHDALICNFSTTGPVERAASQVVMMDVFERYFEYVVVCICGIPAITLEGTPDDWQHLADKVRALKIFDLDWWLPHLLAICNQFVRASRGDVDLEHWQRICKLRSEYGGDIINGWIAEMFPYLREFSGGPCTVRNRIFETGEGFTTSAAPPGLSQVPFIWRNAMTGAERKMEAIGGLIGVEQDPDSRGLRPKIGWAVRYADDIQESLLPGSATENQPVSVEHGQAYLAPTETMPTDLRRFYYQPGKPEAIFKSTRGLIQIPPEKDLEPLDWGTPRPWGHHWYLAIGWQFPGDQSQPGQQ